MSNRLSKSRKVQPAGYYDKYRSNLRITNKEPNGQPLFGVSEALLLAETRQRLEDEQKASVALHSKSTLYLTLSGVFAAFISTSIARLLDHPQLFKLEVVALGLLLLSLGLITLVTILLCQSALSRAYQVIATPHHWVRHLANLRGTLTRDVNPEKPVYARLQSDVLDARVEATETWYAVNEAKADRLALVSKLICVAIPTAFLAVLLLSIHRLVR